MAWVTLKSFQTDLLLAVQGQGQEAQMAMPQ